MTARSQERLAPRVDFSVERFERLPATDRDHLLRVTARCSKGRSRAIGEARLIVDDGDEVHRFGALPDPRRATPADAPGRLVWRAGYIVPASLLRSRTTVFAIEAEDGLLLDLPRPAEVRMPVTSPEPSRGRRVAARAGRSTLVMLVGGILAAALAPIVLPNSAPAVEGSSARTPTAAELVQLEQLGCPLTLDELPPPKKRTPEEQLCAELLIAYTGVEEEEVPTTPSTPPSEESPGEPDTGHEPSSQSSGEQKGSGSEERVPPRRGHGKKRRDGGGSNGGASRQRPPAGRRPDGSPQRTNPGFMDAQLGPATSVPNFVIRKFKVPVFLLPIYQAAGTQYGVRWEVLAAINEVETDYGRNLNVSSAGALGWMQFMPGTWRSYGVDANRDGRRDPYNPVDAIFAAARYLKAAGAQRDVRRAVYAYNHAWWYVDMVMMRAKLIAGVPGDVVSSLTGLTEGRFPVAARARYADDLTAAEARRRVRQGRNAAHVVSDRHDRRAIEIYAREGSPAVAVNDGIVKEIGHSRRLGRYVVLEDVYGNRYTYGRLERVAKKFRAPKPRGREAAPDDGLLSASQSWAELYGSFRSLLTDALDDILGIFGGERRPEPRPQLATRQRLYANPGRRPARNADLDRLLDSYGFSSYDELFAGPLRRDGKDMVLRRFKPGARVVSGTVIGQVGRQVPGKAAHLVFGIRPAGKGAPAIDPKPILDGWKLLEATAIYRTSGTNVLYGESHYSAGQVLLLPKSLLERRVLSDERIAIYPCGRQDIRAGQIDRRVLASLAYLAESGLRPSISSLRCGHSYYTKSGNVSAHSSGNAADIFRVNGIPILGHQERGGITEQTVRRLMLLQGAMRPNQLISLLELGANTFAMGDHNDHIHVGFPPRRGTGGRGRTGTATLRPEQWVDLLARLRSIKNPAVPIKPSKHAVRTRSRPHIGD